MSEVRRSPGGRMLAGSLVLILSLAPLAPAFAYAGAVPRCQPACAAISGSRTPAMPCHAGDMSGCTQAPTCAIGTAAVLQAPIRMRFVHSRRTAPLALAVSRAKRLGFKPPTPPPNS